MRFLAAVLLVSAAVAQEPQDSLEEGEAIVRFLHHSAVAVRTRRHLLVFDYTTRDANGRPRTEGLLDLREMKGRTVTVFVSHAHADHWDDSVLAWAREGKGIRYVASSDVPIGKRPDLTVLSPDQELELAGPSPIRIRTVGSTDAGVAFWVEVDRVAILHTGDLAWWGWKEAEAAAAKKAYLDEIGKLAALKRRPDIALLCADLRLPGAARLSGAPLALETLKPRLAMALHNDQERARHAEAAVALQEAAKGTRVAAVRRAGDEFFLAAERTFDLLSRRREHHGGTDIHFSAEGRVTVRTTQLSVPVGRRPWERRVVLQASPGLVRGVHAWLKSHDPRRIDLTEMKPQDDGWRRPGEPIDALEVTRGADVIPLGREGVIHPAAHDLWNLLDPLLEAAAVAQPDYEGDHQPQWAPK